MPAGEYQFGDGTLLEVNDGASSAFVAVTELENITPPSHDTGAVERKRLSNTTTVEMVPNSRVKLDNCTFTYEMSDEIFARLQTLLTAKWSALGPPKVYYTWRITYPDGLRMSFPAYLQTNKPNQVQGQQISMGTGQLVLTGLITVSDTIA